MRAWILAVAVLGACTPEIVAGAYLCGPDESCPDGQVCNGVTAICGSASTVVPFACTTGAEGDKITEVEPNNGASAAQAFPALECASAPAEVRGCTPVQDAEDWFGFDVPASCTGSLAHVRISSSIAWQTLALQLSGPNGTFDATATACETSFADDGNVQLCLAELVTAGAHYTVRVSPTGDGDCDGACRYNRYTLGVQLGTR